MTTIAFDVMGNDNGVKPAVVASLRFIKKNPDYKVILVGDKKQIDEVLKETHERIEILDIPIVADPKRGAMIVRDKTTSMYKAIELVKKGEAQVVLSAGSSAGYIAYATLSLKRLEGVSRPAFMPVFPTNQPGKRFIMMDVGATLEVDGNLLYQWAKIGKVFSEHVMGVKNPKVSIVNVGAEKGKGLPFHNDAYNLMEEDKNINFQGFVEARELLSYATDVAVVDGYAGNMILKSMEGTGLTIGRTLKKEIKKNPIRILGALFARGALKNLKSTLDFRTVGAAWVIGVDGIVIKSHGSSDEKAFAGAFGQIQEAINNDAMNKIREAIKK
ncbi:phosphate acyltransferase PlsX [Mycoplasma todarodis]|uniref:Phosphate acyltransferase n=1 Tax=Mycoplasma todarodis TaxID=1937191 RepID=A0A4R0XMD7_9MOLU|nr:phosphate acyltransferase PlsX [Mycoplasma todarodis]TCG10612.1 phosphate acyltransferase PlsX [Mycoplasma todarodis]